MALAPFKQLVDGPTLVRSVRPDDIGACLATIDEEATNAVGWSGHSARRVLASVAGGTPPESLYLIIDVATGEVVGAIDVALDLTTPSAARLGGWIAPAHRGHGHMRRAVVMITDYSVRFGVSVRAEAAWGDEAARAVLAGAGLTVEGEDDEHAARDGVRRVAFGRYVPAQPLEPPPSIDDVRNKVARQRTGRRFLLGTIVVTGAVIAFLVISPIWAAEVGDTTVSCGWLFRPATGLTGRAEGFCSLGRIVWGSMTFVAVALLLFLTLAYRASNPTRRKSTVAPLCDGNTVVRIAEPNDALDVVATIDDEVTSEMGWTPDNIDSIATNIGASSYGGQFLVATPSNDQTIGVVSLSIDPGAESQHHVGFWMHPEHRRQGHMTRAVRLVADYVATLGAPLIAETGTHNVATQRVLEQTGFVRTGWRRALLPNDETVDAVVYERPLVVGRSGGGDDGQRG